MNGRTWKVSARVGTIAAAMMCGAAAGAQQARSGGTLTIAGHTEQAPLIRINGKSYVDVESLARITHGTLQFDGSRTILTLPADGTGNAASATADATKPPRLTAGFLSAEVQAVAQVREWHVALVNAVNSSNAITTAWVGPMQRQADAKLQLAVAAATSDPDQKAAELLRNEFANMQQLSDQLVAMHDNASAISPDFFNNNTLDAKILGCEHALTAMASTKQYQDDVQCH